jgi:long-subunit fatty acid transport protein
LFFLETTAMTKDSLQQTFLAAAIATSLCSLSPAASAGGILMYEVGTADVGLAAAGYAARAQDTSTVLTNPAGMTRPPPRWAIRAAATRSAGFRAAVRSTRTACRRI